MDTYELNKIAGAVLGTVLIVMLLQSLAGILYTPEHPETLAYSLEIEGEGTGEATEPTEVVVISMAEMLEGATAEDGAGVIRKCAACHTFESGGENGIGPNLYGVMGRQAATVPGYDYSAGMTERAAEIGIWNFETLNAFLEDPKGYVVGTKMAFNGISRMNQRADLLMYLHDQSDNPIDMPVAEEMAEDAEEMTEDGDAATEATE